MKRSLDGTHHHISREHLSHLAMFDYRHNTGKLSDAHRVHNLMGRVGGRRLTYKRVTADTLGGDLTEDVS